MLIDIDARTLNDWLADDKAHLVDVREDDEYLAEHIPTAALHPLSRLDPAGLPPSNGRKLVLQCRTGVRSADAAGRLLTHGHREVYHLAGGLRAWKKEGLSTVTSGRRAPIGIMRQVQITSGSLVVIGVALGLLVSGWFLGLSAFVGAGLVFAGASGTCGMAALLQRMPWNTAAAGTPPKR